MHSIEWWYFLRGSPPSRSKVNLLHLLQPVFKVTAFLKLNISKTVHLGVKVTKEHQ